MQTNNLVNLLMKTIEVNRIGDYFAAFRYSVDNHDTETLAVDLYKDETGYYHKVVTTNAELDETIKEFNAALSSKTKWNIAYYDEYMAIDEDYPNEAMATAKAFMLKQKYNLDVTITEVKSENL